MSSDESTLSVFTIKRFPAEVREELNRFLRQSSWQRMNKEFSIDVLTGLKAEALDNIADLLNSDYPEFEEFVRKRVRILKSTRRGKTESFKGKSKVGFHSSFYRYLPLSSLVCSQSSLSGRSNGYGASTRTRQDKTRQDKTRQDKTRQDIYYHNITSTIFCRSVS